MHATIPTKPRTRRLAALVALSISIAGGSAWGWGRVGHHVSARLTMTLLTPRTRAAIREILDPDKAVDPDKGLADASVWPDEIRRDRPESGPWHYVNVPITEAKYDARFCQAQAGCVVSKIAEFRAQLKDSKATPEQKRDALRFLAHFVQDMHNPVHVGDRGDRGGNDLQLRFFDDGSNLHRIWDSGILDRAVKDVAADREGRQREEEREEATYRRLLARFTPEFVASVGESSVEDWATESLLAAREAYVVDPATKDQLKAGTKLADAYQARHLPVVEDRIMRASVRLARILNETFDPRPAPGE